MEKLRLTIPPGEADDLRELIDSLQDVGLLGFASLKVKSEILRVHGGNIEDSVLEIDADDPSVIADTLRFFRKLLR